MAENREQDANAVMSRDMGSANTIVVDSGENEKTHEFNEQTNYVPKRAIITVGPIPNNNEIVMLIRSIDISRMRKCRFAGVDGPDYAGNQFIHHRKCFGIDSPGLVDSKWIFHVSLISIGAGLC